MDKDTTINTNPKEDVIQQGRPFASGSRQAPDPYDQYLEQNGFYRKHVARDASCLFRSFSEQVFDVQLYHGKVRNDCIRWMRIKSEEYKKKIVGDFDEYMTEMCKPRSYGSFVELHALAHAYRRNILLFEPYNLGSWYVKDDCYKETVMVFFSPDKHFDSIFPTSFIQQAAYCQALVYEILYIKLFKLPDVMYSVERMLHDPDGKAVSTAKSLDKTNNIIEDRVVMSERGQFGFDTAEETECVLDNYLLCHFHNRDNFDTIVDKYRNKKHEISLKDTRTIKSNCSKRPLTRELINPMLCDRKISCVRQLLKEGITPFPYKVAKALDPNIYRNIEFDSWSEMRRELKHQNWYFEQSCLKVGAKCMVRLNESDDRMLYGYIQDMSPDKGPCVVYVEDVGECRTLPYERLHPLSRDRLRSFAVPYKTRRSSAIQHLKISNNNQSRKKMLKALNSSALSMKSPDKAVYQYNTPYYETDKPFYYIIQHLTNMDDFQSDHFEMMLMPFTTVGPVKSKSNHGKNEPVDGNERSIDNDYQTDGENYASLDFYDVSAPSNLPYTNQTYCYTYAEPFPYEQPAQSAYCAFPYFAQPFAFSPNGPYPGTFYRAQYPMAAPIGENRGTCEIPNFQAVASMALNGSDLPFNDHVTLRYFYNLGVEYFRNNQFHLEPPSVINLTRDAANINSDMVDVNDVKELADELKHGINLNVSNESDAQNKKRVFLKTDIPQNTTRKLGSENPEKEASNPNKVNTLEYSAASISCIDVGQSTNRANQVTTDDIQDSYEYMPLAYSHVPVMPPVQMPYIAVDSSHFMVTPNGHGFMAPSSEVMLIHGHAHPPSLNPIEAVYQPMAFASQSVGTGYAIMGYLQPPTHFNQFTNGTSNADNEVNDVTQ